MTDSISGVFDDHARVLNEAHRERLADELEALAVRVRTEAPLRGAATREFDGLDRWLLLVEWQP